MNGDRVEGNNVNRVEGESGMILNVVNGGHECRKENREMVSSGVKGTRLKGARLKGERVNGGRGKAKR